MKVILLEKVAKLGQIGQVVDVKSGFARNFLIPRQKALRANDANIAVFEARKAELEEQNKSRMSDAEKLSISLKGAMVTLIRQASEVGLLYGSVRNKDISDMLKQQGFDVPRQLIRLTNPIKTLGIHEAEVVLHPDVVVAVKVNVALSEEEASVQAANAQEAVEETQE